MTISFSTEEYKSFQVFLENACGIVLGDNKQYLVSSRLGRFMKERDINTLKDLVDKLNQARNSELNTKVIEAMTTHETLWFRDTYPYQILSDIIFESYKQQRKNSVRIWSSACSSGQEPYSISMITDEFSKKSGSINVEITATDISNEIINAAKLAQYDSLALARGLSEERKLQYFSQMGNLWQVNSKIRQRVKFREINLLRSYTSLGKFDIIFCRNVLIYFSPEAKKDIIERMASLLNPGGYLLLGSSEAISQYTDKFEMIRTKLGVVYQIKSN